MTPAVAAANAAAAAAAPAAAPGLAPPLLSVEGVSVHFPQGGGGWLSRAGPRRVLRAVEDVSFTVQTGETLALVGESGSGKTTLGHVVAGLRAPTSGTVRFHCEAAAHQGRRGAAAPAVQVVFQDPFDALDPRMPVSAIIAEPLRIAGRPAAEQARRAAELAAQVGLPRDALDRYPHEFSGGQRQRIAIARALAPRPRLIVADEPLSALDVSIGSQVLNLLRDVQADAAAAAQDGGSGGGLAYLFISHDLAVVDHLADRVAVLYLGRLVELAPRAELFARPSHPYTRALLDAVPRLGRRRARGTALRGEMPSPLAPPPGCVFHPRCPKAQAVCRVEPPALLPPPGRLDVRSACHFRE